MLGGGVSCWSLRLMAGAAMMRLPLAFCSVKAWQKFPGLTMDHGVVFILVGFMFFKGYLLLYIDTRHDMHPASALFRMDMDGTYMDIALLQKTVLHGTFNRFMLFFIAKWQPKGWSVGSLQRWHRSGFLYAGWEAVQLATANSNGEVFQEGKVEDLPNTS